MPLFSSSMNAVSSHYIGLCNFLRENIDSTMVSLEPEVAEHYIFQILQRGDAWWISWGDEDGMDIGSFGKVCHSLVTELHNHLISRLVPPSFSFLRMSPS